MCWLGKCDNDPSEYQLCARWQRREPGCHEGPEEKKSTREKVLGAVASVIETVLEELTWWS